MNLAYKSSDSTSAITFKDFFGIIAKIICKLPPKKDIFIKGINKFLDFD